MLLTISCGNSAPDSVELLGANGTLRTEQGDVAETLSEAPSEASTEASAEADIAGSGASGDASNLYSTERDDATASGPDLSSGDAEVTAGEGATVAVGETSSDSGSTPSESSGVASSETVDSGSSVGQPSDETSGASEIAAAVPAGPGDVPDFVMTDVWTSEPVNLQTLINGARPVMLWFWDVY